MEPTIPYGPPEDAPRPGGRRFTVLVIADDAAGIDRLADELAVHFVVERATSAALALGAVAARTPDALFVDHILPDGCGIELIDELRKAGCDAPVIMLTAGDDVGAVAAALRRGAADFVVKDSDDALCEQLIPTAIRAIEKWNKDKELEYLRQRQDDQARHARQLNDELRDKNDQLERACAQIEESHRRLRHKNERLSELYDTAHRFVDNVSHEMRTPLTVIKEFIAIIIDGLAGPLTEQQREYLDIAAAKTGDLTQMVDDMLDLSKLEAGLLRVERTRTPLADILERVADTLHQKARISEVDLDIDLPADLPPLFCDREKIGRVLINLVTNAMKFSEAGSSVRIWARCQQRPDEVFVGVSDHGPGIADEHLRVIFERFKQVGAGTRASTRGFGLGLNIVRELVHLSLGEVSVESALGAGSTFGFTLPVFDHRLIMTRYLERLPMAAHGRGPLALIRAHPGAPSSDVAGHIREVVAHWLQPFDLAFERPGHGDVVVVSPTDDAEGLAHRLAVHHREDLRLSPGSTVEIAFDVLARWSADDDPSAIADFFAQQFDPRETADA